MTRCKFRCTKSENGHIVLEPVTSGSPENESFFHYTPWGRLEFGTVNETAANEFKVGSEYYINIEESL